MEFMELEQLLPSLVAWIFSVVQTFVFGVFIIVTVGILRNEGGVPYLKRLWAVFIEIPGIKDLMAMLVRRQVKSFIKETADKIGPNFVRGKKILEIPEKGNVLFICSRMHDAGFTAATFGCTDVCIGTPSKIYNTHL